MGTLKLKENIDIDKELTLIGFTKGREYYNCGDISVKISTKDIFYSFTSPTTRHVRSIKLFLPKILLIMIEKGLVE